MAILLNLVKSSYHYGTTKVAPPSDHLHTKRTQQRKLIGETNIHQKCGGMAPCPSPAGFATVANAIIRMLHFCSIHSSLTFLISFYRLACCIVSRPTVHRYSFLVFLINFFGHKVSGPRQVSGAASILVVINLFDPCTPLLQLPSPARHRQSVF